MKDKAFDISQGVFAVPIWEIEFFLPYFTVSPVFMKYGTVHKQVVGEKTKAVFGFRKKNSIILNVVFRFSRPEINFTVKLKKIKWHNFHDFSTSKHNAPEPFVLYRRFFLQTDHNFIAFPK